MALFLFSVALAIEYMSIHVYLFGLLISEASSHYFKPIANSALFQDCSGEPCYQQSYIPVENESAVSV